MASNNSDRFKRRLIRSVASLMNKGITGNDLWSSVQEQIGSDCSVLWQRMRWLTLSRVRNHVQAYDIVQHVTPIGRMTKTDWLMYDLILVHENIDVIYTNHIYEKCLPQPLLDLLSLVIKFNIENEDRKKLPKTWLRLTTEYNKNGRNSSAMLLQKRWFQMKEATRKSFYQFWFKNHKKFESAKKLPKPIYILVASRFPKFISLPFVGWLELIDMKKVVLPSDFESIVNAIPVNDNPESECVLLEPKIDIVNIDEDTTQEEAKIYIEIDVNFNEESNLQEEVKLETSDNDHLNLLNVKSEPSEPANSDIDVINPKIESTDYLSQIQIVATTHIEQVDTLEGEDCDVHESLNSKEDSDVVIKVKSELEADQKDDNTQIIEEPDGNLDKSAISKGEGVNDLEVHKEDEDIQLIGESDHEFESPFNEDRDDSYTFVGVKNGVAGLNDEEILDEYDDIQIIGESNCKFEEGPVNKGQDVSDISLGVEDEVAQVIEREADQEDEYSDLEFVDEGIDFIDNDCLNKSRTKVNENGANDIGKTFDKKLIMTPIIYTKKLDHMNVLKNKELNSEMNVKDIINDIIGESKPRYEAEVKENATADDDIEQDMEDDHETISLTSSLLQKPTHCTYNPIVLCKNPDFNTRLKRLGVGFLTVPKNLQLLKACKPVSIDLHKAFENKLVNNVLYLKTDSSVKRAVNFKPPVSNRTATSTVIPSALAAQALINNSSVHFEPYVHNSIETSPATPSPIHVQTLINNSSDNVKPTVSETIATTSTVSPSASSVSSSMNTAETEPLLAKNSCLVISSKDLNKSGKSKSKADYSNSKTKAKPTREMAMPWFIKRASGLTPAQQNHLNDEVLLTEDTVEKVLHFLNESIKGIDNINMEDFKLPPRKLKRVKGKLQKRNISTKNIVKESPQTSKQSCVVNSTKSTRETKSSSPTKSHVYNKVIDEALIKYLLSLSEFEAKKYWKSRKQCCSMRRKMEWSLLRKNGVKLGRFSHVCLARVNRTCTCCCVEQCFEYKPELIISSKAPTQPIAQISNAKHTQTSIPRIKTSIVHKIPKSMTQNETLIDSPIASEESSSISPSTASISYSIQRSVRNPVLVDEVSNEMESTIYSPLAATETRSILLPITSVPYSFETSVSNPLFVDEVSNEIECTTCPPLAAIQTRSTSLPSASAPYSIQTSFTSPVLVDEVSNEMTKIESSTCPPLAAIQSRSTSLPSASAPYSIQTSFTSPVLVEEVSNEMIKIESTTCPPLAAIQSRSTSLPSASAPYSIQTSFTSPVLVEEVSNEMIKIESTTCPPLAAIQTRSTSLPSASAPYSIQTSFTSPVLVEEVSNEMIKIESSTCPPLAAIQTRSTSLPSASAPYSSQTSFTSPVLVDEVSNEIECTTCPPLAAIQTRSISQPATSAPYSIQTSFTNSELVDESNKVRVTKILPTICPPRLSVTSGPSLSNFQFVHKRTGKKKLQNPVLISPEKGGKISIDATWLDSPYSRSLGINITSTSKDTASIIIQPLKQGKTALYVGVKKILLTTANMVDFEKFTSKKFQNVRVVNSTNTNSILKNIIQSNKNVVADNVPEQAHDNNESETNTSKKSILSDLMEMSGISAEDTDAGTTQSNTSQIKQSTETVPNLLNALKLHVICSLTEVKWATRQNAKFFTLDFSSGHIYSVSIHVKQFQTKVPINDVIEIEDSDEEAPEKKIKITNNRNTPFRFATSILKRSYPNRNNKNNLNTDLLMILNRKKNEHKKRKQTHDTMVEEYLLDSDDSILNSGAEIDTLETSSDDEPLSAVSKRMRTNDNVEENEESIKPNEVILENEESITLNEEIEEIEESILGI